MKTKFSLPISNSLIYSRPFLLQKGETAYVTLITLRATPCHFSGLESVSAIDSGDCSHLFSFFPGFTSCFCDALSFHTALTDSSRFSRDIYYHHCCWQRTPDHVSSSADVSGSVPALDTAPAESVAVTQNEFCTVRKEVM